MLWTLLAALLAADPQGTVSIDLKPGDAAPIATRPPATVICDDPNVAKGEFTEDGDGFVLRAVKPGTTLCGVWIDNQIPAGLYRVTVAEPPQKKPEKPAKPDAAHHGP